MAIFPISEQDVLDLCNQMIAGYTAHAADFPSMTPLELTALTNALTGFEGCKVAQDAARASAKIATSNKDESLVGLVDAMKVALRHSELDCHLDPELLAYIGWGPRADVAALPAVPLIPTNFRITAEGPTDIWFAWDQPDKGAVRHWLIERRQQTTPGTEFGPWTLAGTSLNCEAHLVDQPRGVQMEYRARGENPTGQSSPSPIMAAVL
jgi:hypothetical protein